MELMKLLDNRIAFSLFLLVLAFSEAWSMALFKSPNNLYVVLGFVFYMIVTLGLVYLVRTRGLAVGHALYDVSSIIIATIVGLFVLGETVDIKKQVGLFLAIVSVVLLQ